MRLDNRSDWLTVKDTFYMWERLMFARCVGAVVFAKVVFYSGGVQLELGVWNYIVHLINYNTFKEQNASLNV